jgi:hypothetical protein
MVTGRIASAISGMSAWRLGVVAVAICPLWGMEDAVGPPSAREGQRQRVARIKLSTLGGPVQRREARRQVGPLTFRHCGGMTEDRSRYIPRYLGCGRTTIESQDMVGAAEERPDQRPIKWIAAARVPVVGESLFS